MTKTEKTDLLPLVPTGNVGAGTAAEAEEVASESTLVNHTQEADFRDRIESGQSAAPANQSNEIATGGVPMLQFLGAPLEQPSKSMSAHERLLLLTASNLPSAGSEPPAARELAATIRDTIGPVARRLSPEEVASALGHPEWTAAVAELGSPSCIERDQRAPHFLLAAHLSRWMDNVEWKGASLDDVTNSFVSAHPQVAERYPYLNGDFLSVLQKAHRFMPQWQAKPSASQPSSTWLDVARGEARPVDTDTRILSTALEELSEVPLTMELTSKVGARLRERQPFANQNLVMVQHLLGQAHPMLDAMVDAGLDPSRGEYVRIPYQDGPAPQLTIERSFGMPVTLSPRGDIPAMKRAIAGAIDRAYQRHLDNGDPILVFDDGGYASKYIAEKYADQAHLFKVVEQTTRGLTEISTIDDPRFSIVDVADSYGKKIEAAQVGDVVVQAIRKVLDVMTATPIRKDVLVVGGGKVGKAVAASFAGDGSRVHMFDPYLTPREVREFKALGYDVITDKQEALRRKFLVVGCSGFRSINMEDFAVMSSPVFVASASSKRVEIATLSGSDQATTDEGQLRRILAARVGEQESYYYWLKDGRTVVAMADTLPVNFQNVNSIPPELIDHTMALLLLAGAQAVDSDGHGLEELDPFGQFFLQASMEGLHKDLDGPAEISIEIGGEAYSGTRAAWHRIASSEATPPEVLESIYEAFFEHHVMEPVLLDALGQHHPVPDSLVDRVLEYPLLPHVARLAHNEDLTLDQQAKVLDFVQRCYEDIVEWKYQGEMANLPVAVEYGADGGYVYTRNAPSTAPRDLLLSQLGAILFSHPRCPPGFREHMLSRARVLMQHTQAANVHLLGHPAWSGENLMELLNASTTSLSQVGSKPSDRALYLSDVFETIRDHPNATREVRDTAQRLRVRMLERLESKLTHRTVEEWHMSPLGVPLPEYL